MAPTGDATLPATRRSRKSIGAQSPNKKTSDKENATIDMGSTLAANRKKSRSKSIGPGGLDGIKASTGNRRVSLAAPSRPPPRSILKQPIQSLPEIPPHKPKAQGGLSKAATPSNEDNTESSNNSGTKIALRTEEQQQAAAREREERERLEAEREATSRREARRKSLANRRVSFAAEATLHTFSIEYVQDSTTSTDSTRRTSSIAGQSQTPSSHPPEEVEEEEPEPELPSEKRRRRSSGIPPLNFNNPDDDTLSSTVYSSDSEHTDADGVAEIQGEELSDSESEVEDGTMMTVDADEMTSASVASVVSARSQESDSTSLDENLRLAARMAATQQLEEDDDDNEEEEIIGFAGWVKKGNNQPKEGDTLKRPEKEQASPEKQDDDGTEMDMDMSMDVDMELTHAVGGILQSRNGAPDLDEGEDMDMSMDVTRVLGGIISHAKSSTRRQSVKPPLQEPEEDDEEVPMDFTTAVGGIKPARTSDESQMSLEENEDMSMELTTAIGSVIPLTAKGRSPKQSRRRSMAPRKNNLDDEDGAMDMTVAVGRILPTAPTQIEEDVDEATIGMDMTTAIGGIIGTTSQPQDRQTARKVMELEASEAGVEAIAAVETESPPKTKHRLSIADENGSPGMGIFRGKGLLRSSARGASNSALDESKAEASKTLVDSSVNTSTPSPPKLPLGSTPKTASPLKTTTPSQTATPPRKAATPTPVVETPTRAPPPKMIGSRSTSPKRRQSPTISTPRSAAKPKPFLSTSLFHQDPSTGATTPRVVLSPKRRRHSGVGIDRPGLGSPRISELLDRRESIGDSALSFSPAPTSQIFRKGVSFADPREMAEEIDRERQLEEDRENKRKILEREADGDVTANLREMIQSLSPKKAPLRGRKSLHVGSARGVLGKRPAELDEDEAEEDEDSGGVKRLKGLMGSPVKNVRLEGPPSKAETTTGRRTRATAKMDGDKENVTPSLSSPIKISSPKGQGRFRDVDDEPTNTFNFEQPQAVGDREEVEGDEDRIHLQDFLNMTSIRFMELTTTKRRHTVAPAPQRESGVAEDGDVSLEKCVVAGACTVPMLELYQHSCRELKKYISEGRRIVREIETETFEENPPLFREYISASPEFKLIMDNQFKNVKTHARLLSKAMWYEWRMKLQDGLKEGLIKIAEGMTNDDELLREQEELLASIVPDLVRKYEALAQENEELEAVARELADCDPADLEAARADLVAVGEEIEEKSKKLAAMRQQLEESEENIRDLTARKQHCLDEIKAADQVREECRGWSLSEIATLKGQVELLERQHGWAITGIVDTTVSLTYRREIELVLDISSFQPSMPNSRIDLWYIADKHEYKPIPATVEREFFLQCIRDQVRGMPQAQTKIRRVLAVVGAAWDMGRGVADHVRMLNVQFPTTVSKTSDSEICIRSSLVLVPLASKVDVLLHLKHRMVEGQNVEVAVVPRAEIVYGESFKTDKVAEFLASRIGTKVKGWEEKGESWLDVVAELHGRLVARGRK